MLTLKYFHQILKFIKIFIITVFTYKTTKKIMNSIIKDNNIIMFIFNILVCVVYNILKIEVGLLYAIIIIITLLGAIISRNSKNRIIYSIVCTAISFTINNILFLGASAMGFIPKKIFNIQNDLVVGISINVMYIIIATLFLRIKKLKNGLSFLKNSMNNEYFEIVFLNISAIILFSVVLLVNYNINVVDKIGVSLIILGIIMFITIQKSLQLYYKQKLLIQELEKTKEELANKTKEVEELEAENLSFSKKSHTLAHKQKSLEYKLEEIINKTEISKEEAAEVRDRLKEIEKDLYKEKTIIEIDKSGITQIDDM